MTWFHKHIDKTFLIFLVIWLSLTIFIRALLVNSDLSNVAYTILIVLTSIISTLLLFLVAGWYIKQKDRSMAWLFLLLIPVFGIVGILGLWNLNKNSEGYEGMPEDGSGI